MNYLAWRDRADGKRCHLTGLLNSADVYAYLCEGMPLEEKWTEEAAYKMDQDYKTRIQLTDSLIDQDDVIVASERLKAFLEENGAAEGLFASSGTTLGQDDRARKLTPTVGEVCS